MFANKTLLITGGTGSFGEAVLRRFSCQPVKSIRIFSRDEKKQEDLRQRFPDKRLQFFIGDVRDAKATHHAMTGVDLVFHAAALKQVPSCEFHPMEAVRTNVVGTENVLDAAIANGVGQVICLSTDKAVYPINAMGLSKAMMEKVMIAKARLAVGTATTISATRYGNVLASRGSVIPLFVDQVRRGVPITLTNPAMSRFVMTLDEAIELVLHAFRAQRNGDIFVQKAPAVTIQTLAEAVLDVLGRPDHPIKVIGTRHGEKAHEALMTQEEALVAVDRGTHFSISHDVGGMDYSAYIDKGRHVKNEIFQYNSKLVKSLSREEMRDILLKLNYIRGVLAGDSSGGEV